MTKPIYEQFITQRGIFEHVTVIVPQAESGDVLAAMHDAGWRMTRVGPYTDRKMFPKTDLSRSLFTAEREIEDDD